MQLALDPVASALAEEHRGYVYVYKLGGSGIIKVGKAKNPDTRRAAYRTISTEPLVEYARIPTTCEHELEKFIKSRLQSRRWLDSEGRELYEVDEVELDQVIEAARDWDANVLPRIAEAAALSKLATDGTVLTPGQLEQEQHRELLRWRQVELTAKQEQARIVAQFQLTMRAAAVLSGIATWETQTATTFDEARFKLEHPPLYDEYHSKVNVTRPFRVRW